VSREAAMALYVYGRRRQLRRSAAGRRGARLRVVVSAWSTHCDARLYVRLGANPASDGEATCEPCPALSLCAARPLTATAGPAPTEPG
jgi:hypothetical protein